MKRLITTIYLIFIFCCASIKAQELLGGELIIDFVDRPAEWVVNVNIQALGTHWDCYHSITNEYNGATIIYDQNGPFPNTYPGHASDACWDYQGYDPPLAIGKYRITVAQSDPHDAQVSFDFDWRTSDLPPGPGVWIDQHFEYSINEHNLYRYSDPNKISIGGQTLTIWDEIEQIDHITTELEPLPPEDLYWYNFFNYPRLEWSHSSNPDDYVTDYEVHRYTGGQEWDLIATRPDRFPFYVDWEIDLSAPEQYEYLLYKIRSKNGNRVSDEFSNTIVIFSPGNFGKYSDGTNPAEEIICEYKLEQNYPNPFNPQTTIEFSIKDNSLVTLKVFDILGKEVSTLVNDHLPAGNHQVEFNGSGLESGIYFYEIRANEFREVKKLILVK
jgi:hypothetical protein